MIDRCIHLAYYDPATGHVPNPGMGINAYEIHLVHRKGGASVFPELYLRIPEVVDGAGEPAGRAVRRPPCAGVCRCLRLRHLGRWASLRATRTTHEGSWAGDFPEKRLFFPSVVS